MKKRRRWPRQESRDRTSRAGQRRRLTPNERRVYDVYDIKIIRKLRIEPG